MEQPFRYYCPGCQLSVVSTANPVFPGFNHKREELLLANFLNRHASVGCAMDGYPTEEPKWPELQSGKWGRGPYPEFIPDES